MQNHRRKLKVERIGTWLLNAPRGTVEFVGEHGYAPAINANLWKFFEGGNKPVFVDPRDRFVLVDAQDEVLRGDAESGELKTVAILKRQQDQGLRRSTFVTAEVPILIFENGLVVFRSDGEVCWSRNDLKLDQFFQDVVNERVIYFSEFRGKWAYNLRSGDPVAAE